MALSLALSRQVRFPKAWPFPRSQVAAKKSIGDAYPQHLVHFVFLAQSLIPAQSIQVARIGKRLVWSKGARLNVVDDTK
jgi:hypothetical protein